MDKTKKFSWLHLIKKLSTVQVKFSISLTEDVFDNPTELCNNVKRILEVIMSLTVDDEPSFKRRHMQEKIKKNRRYNFTDIGIEILSKSKFRHIL